MDWGGYIVIQTNPYVLLIQPVDKTAINVTTGGDIIRGGELLCF